MEKSSLNNLYNKIGQTYKKNRQKTNAEYTEIPTIISLAGEVKGKMVLDAGCGLGKHSQLLIKKGAIVTGIDLSKNMVEYTKDLCGKKGNFFVADFTKVSFPSASFDLIVASYSLHYIKDINSVFKRFYRFLKSNGRIIFSIYHPIRLYQKISKFDYSKSKKYWFNLNSYGVRVFNYYHPLPEYIDAIVQNGFEVDKIREPVVSRNIKGFEDAKYRIPSGMIFEITKK